jgi:hypothetical protein
LKFEDNQDDGEVDGEMLDKLKEISSILTRNLAKFVDVYDNELAIWTKKNNVVKTGPIGFGKIFGIMWQ